MLTHTSRTIPPYGIPMPILVHGRQLRLLFINTSHFEMLRDILQRRPLSPRAARAPIRDRTLIAFSAPLRARAPSITILDGQFTPGRLLARVFAHLVHLVRHRARASGEYTRTFNRSRTNSPTPLPRPRPLPRPPRQGASSRARASSTVVRRPRDAARVALCRPHASSRAAPRSRHRDRATTIARPRRES